MSILTNFKTPSILHHNDDVRYAIYGALKYNLPHGEFNSWNYEGKRLFSGFFIDNSREGELIDYEIQRDDERSGEI